MYISNHTERHSLILHRNTALIAEAIIIETCLPCTTAHSLLSKHTQGYRSLTQYTKDIYKYINGH